MTARLCLAAALSVAAVVAPCPDVITATESVDACLRECTVDYAEPVTRDMTSTCDEKAAKDGGFPWGNLITTFFLLILSGLFSGLTLGLMGLDVSGLEIIIKGSKDEEEIANAEKIMPLRKKGNLLLCTLLLGNTAVNAFLTVVTAELTSGAMGAAISTGLIVIFGEIFPQAACSRFALSIGAKSVPLVWLFVFVLCPIAYPISLVLDQLLGDEMATTYDSDELKQLIANQIKSGESNVENMQGQIMLGALDVNLKAARELMTPWQSVYAMSTSETIDSDTVMELYEYGYTRIPV